MMTGIRRTTLAGLLFFCLAAPSTAMAVDDCAARIKQLEQKNARLHKQLRQVKRELAREQTEEQEAGWPQVLGGIGIIFGLSGVAMMVSAKRNTR
ncbi:hypothetical protein C2E25_14100 [Geothermobacter hydrogeniphilus]|uniref:Uncharacterized protein n=1 Tax=Geothermobacter hydrogeniphilus TaxID=1969733 RepID=A0A2K2H736_9BACT|nr:hypothetical protein [Geothermobacter hydrogeniphilus]PNU19125.1 hypothetical protein C2E25_14100 [Geothermobacter hydrogeniphilus]